MLCHEPPLWQLALCIFLWVIILGTIQKSMGFGLLSLNISQLCAVAIL